MRCWRSHRGWSLALFLALFGPQSSNLAWAELAPEGQFMISRDPRGITVARPSTTAARATTGLERATTLDGTKYAVIAPIINTGGNSPFFRLFNTSLTTGISTTFPITVIGEPSGTVYGTAQITVPARAAPQYSLSDVLTAANAGALTGGDTDYAFYIAQTDKNVFYEAFQYAIWNKDNLFFENASICSQAPLLNDNNVVEALNNVYTSAVSGYPSYIFIHNYTSAGATYTIAAYDSNTGALIGSTPFTAAANASYMVPESYFEQQLKFTPSASQFNINLFVTIGGTPSSPINAVMGHFIYNQQRTAYVNMTETCMVEAD